MTESGDQTGQKMSLKQGILTVMSLMIGSGIFSNSNSIHASVQSPLLALGIFLLTGVLSLTGALCYAELGTMIPGSGGESQYLARGFGSWAASFFDWTSIMIMKPGSLAVFSLPFASHLINAIRLIREMANSYFFKKQENFLESAAKQVSPMLYNIETMVAVGMIWIVTLSACASVKRCDQIVGVLTYSKLVALASIVIIGFVNSFRRPLTFLNNFEGAASTKLQDFSLLTFSLALYDGLWSFDGWNNLNIVAGNLSNPKRNLPMAIWISVCVVLGMYLAAMLGYYAVLDSEQFANTKTLAITFGFVMFGKAGAVVFALLVCASVFAAALSGMTTSSEIIVLSAKNRFFPSFLGTTNKNTGTAVNAYLSQGIIASFFLIIPRFINEEAFRTLIDVYTLPTWLFYGSSVIVLILMRFREPKIERPYKVWPTTPLLFLIACVWLIVVAYISNWVLPSVAFALVLGGIPIYMMRRSAMKMATGKQVQYN